MLLVAIVVRTIYDMLHKMYYLTIIKCKNFIILSLSLSLSVTLQVVATFTQRKEESFAETTPLPPPDIEVPETDAGIQTFPSIPLTTPVRVSPTSTSRVTTREREQEQIFHQQVLCVCILYKCVCISVCVYCVVTVQFILVKVYS